MNVYDLPYRWLTLGVAVLGGVLVTGCATPSRLGGVESTGSPPFSLRDVYRECNQLGCREPNRVVARYFSTIVNKTGRGCIVHVAPEHAEIPWRYWDEYLRPMRRSLVGSRVRLYAYVPKGQGKSGLKTKAQRTLRQVKELYKKHGAAGGNISMRLISDPSTVVPPYREPYCGDRATLEIVEGARVVSPAASQVAERIVAKDRAARTVLVVMETGKGV